MRAPPRVWSRFGWLVAITLACVTQTSQSAARARGIVADGCNGCHGGGTVEAPVLTMTADPATFEPGDSITLSVSVRWPSIRDAGVYIWTSGLGTFQPLSGEGLTVNGQGLTHTTPKAAANGAVTFRFGWRAPAAPGAVDFGVAAVAGNGNNASSGDSPGFQAFSWVYGCTGRPIYVDLDRDGYGSKQLGTRLLCVDDPMPAGFAARDGDCDENSEISNPGGTEVCNKRDDDCDGQVDEGASPVSMWPDGDGDGFYATQSGMAKLGCGNVAGYAALGGDCDDHDASVNPNVTETCNNRDDDCDGDVDERVRPQCGAGWCARYSQSCNPADCQPGPPRTETCNAFDDDCDGETDNAACADGLVCSNSRCVAPGTLTDPTQGTAGTAPTGLPDPTLNGAGMAATPRAAPKPASAGCSLTRGNTPGVPALGLLLALGIGAGVGRRGSRAERSPVRHRGNGRLPESGGARARVFRGQKSRDWESGSLKSTLLGMSVTRLEREGFVVERHGQGTATYFVYAGRMRHVELLPSHAKLHVPYTRLDESEHVDPLIDALWELSVPGVVDVIEVAYREGDPNETMVVRER